MNAPWLLALLVQHAPPGNTAFSVELAGECKNAEVCEGARWSDFYSAWIRKESAAQGAERYEAISTALIDSTRELLCRNDDDSRVEGCQPAPEVSDPKSKRPRWDVVTLSVAGAALAMLESGFREDVQVGRGSARKPSSDGGRGRGPGGEACLVQAHPYTAWRFADAEPDLREKAAAGDSAARAAIAASLLGTDQESLKRCFRTGLRMLIHARAHCSWASPQTDWDFATFAMYGTGTSCTSPNDGKTTMRTRLFRQLLREAKMKRSPTRKPSS
ncbi:MAG TPA: hypothetical protein VGP93_01255 [Polyangiaceae bacterium]|jgi:hypothetical protein|nr:hypothetical protein [Polyangiaceae bacterium]